MAIYSFWTRIPHRTLDKGSMSPWFLNSARSRSEVLLSWGDVKSNRWSHDHKYHWESTIQQGSSSGKGVSWGQQGWRKAALSLWVWRCKPWDMGSELWGRWHLQAQELPAQGLNQTVKKMKNPNCFRTPSSHYSNRTSCATNTGN